MGRSRSRGRLPQGAAAVADRRSRSGRGWWGWWRCCWSRRSRCGGVGPGRLRAAGALAAPSKGVAGKAATPGGRHVMRDAGRIAGWRRAAAWPALTLPSPTAAAQATRRRCLAVRRERPRARRAMDRRGRRRDPRASASLSTPALVQIDGALCAPASRARGPRRAVAQAARALARGHRGVRSRSPAARRRSGRSSRG